MKAKGCLWFNGSFKACMQKIKGLTQEMKQFYAFMYIFSADRQTLWLIEVLHAIKRALEDCMQKIKGLNQEARKI